MNIIPKDIRKESTTMELKINIKNGLFDLTASGSILIVGDKPTTFTILDNGLPLDIIMKFENDESNTSESKREIKVFEDQNAFEITFTNYNSFLGLHNKEPWLIGDSFGRRLYLLYVISGFNESSFKRIEYTFFLGEELNNG
jgi:hypothetical protein